MRCGDILETEGAIAIVAEEVGMHVVDGAMGFAMADFIFRNPASVFERVNYIVVEQKVEHSQDTGTVEGFKIRFEFYEPQASPGVNKAPQH